MEKKQNNGKVSGIYHLQQSATTEEKQQQPKKKTTKRTLNPNPNNFCKIIPGIHKYKNYKEMCNAIGIEPLSKRKERELQLEELKKYYDIKIHSNYNITLTYFTAREKRKQVKEKKYNISKKFPELLNLIESQKIISFEGKQINCYNPKLFSKNKNGIYPYSDINDWLLYIVFSLQRITINGYFFEFLKFTAIYQDLLQLRDRDFYLTLGKDIRIYKGFYLYIIKPLRQFMLSKYKYFQKQGLITIDRGLLGLDTNYKQVYISFTSEEYQEAFQETCEKYNISNNTDLYLLSKKDSKLYEEIQNDIKASLMLECNIKEFKYNYYTIEPTEEYSQIEEYQKYCDSLFEKYSNPLAIKESIIKFMEIMRGKLICNLTTQIYKNRFKHTSEDILLTYIKDIQKLINRFCVYTSDFEYTDDYGNIQRIFYTYQNLLEWEEMRKLDEERHPYLKDENESKELKSLDIDSWHISPTMFAYLNNEELQRNYSISLLKKKKSDETIEYINKNNEEIEDAYEEYYLDTKDNPITYIPPQIYESKKLDMDDIEDEYTSADDIF